jgi:hypothetical protein
MGLVKICIFAVVYLFIVVFGRVFVGLFGLLDGLLVVVLVER